MRNLYEPLGASGFDCSPQIVGARVAICMLFHVSAQAIAPYILASKSLQHGDDSFTLLVRDGIKRLACLLNGADLLNHRMRCHIGIQAHCTLAAIDAVQVALPFRVEMRGRLAFHPAGKTFVEPQVIPPRHGYEIAEPLVCNFMGVRCKDALAGAGAGDFWIVQQDAFEGKDGTPIFHSAEKLALSGAGYIIELWQGIGRVKIFVIIAYNLGRSIKRILALWSIALTDHDANFGRTDLFGNAVKFAHSEKQQIGRHFRCSSKADFGRSIA